MSSGAGDRTPRPAVARRGPSESRTKATAASREADNSKRTSTPATDLFSMASSPALPLYASRYSTPNGYPQINGEVDAPLDFRKVESLRRYVQWRSDHQSTAPRCALL
uniref:Uncharacterized protein n=1 Tax=Anopheles dirus TaxID=7168 RepID=A0A182N7D4_9DIPT